MKLVKNYINKITVLLSTLFVAFQCLCTNVYAKKTNIKDTKLFTGTEELVGDLQVAVIGLSAGVAILVIAYNLVKMKMADDEQDTKIYKKRIKVTLICAILIVVLTSLLPAILSYYS